MQNKDVVNDTLTRIYGEKFMEHHSICRGFFDWPAFRAVNEKAFLASKVRLMFRSLNHAGLRDEVDGWPVRLARSHQRPSAPLASR